MATPVTTKILFVNTRESDGVQDLMYSGLAKVLGPKNVIDYPWNPYFHFGRRKYPANLGYTSGSLLPSVAARLKSKTFSFVIVGAAKPACFQTYLSLVGSIPSSVPVVFLDGGDLGQLGGDMIRLNAEGLYHESIERRPFDAVFKREYPSDRELGKRVWPLQFSFNFDRLPRQLPSETKYDVAFWAVESNPVRTEVLKLIENRFDCRENGTHRNQVARRYVRKGVHYLRELAACKVVLNFPGVGWDTQRYWEVPALGRFMISMRPRILIPDNFLDQEHVVFCNDDLSDLIELCEYYLRNPVERERIASNAREFARRRHSNVARDSYMLEKLMTLR